MKLLINDIYGYNFIYENVIGIDIKRIEKKHYLMVRFSDKEELEKFKLVNIDLAILIDNFMNECFRYEK